MEEFIYEYAEIFKALSNPTRLCIVNGLYDHPEGMNVSNIQDCIEISQSSVSQHLRILKQANILDSKRYGTVINYSLANDKVRQIIELIRE
ncbi:MAG: metalloregulator ArsR/SmtB family transcription factor [Tissierellia bacterium]|nr:metalloregulator ArsR/SmtB family transcription factor [Tissierellia bacterium]